MNVETPGVNMFRKDMYILQGANSAAKMRKDLGNMVNLANKLLDGEEIGPADQAGYFPRLLKEQRPENHQF